MPWIESINYIHTDHHDGQVADGTVEGDAEEFSPETGKQWEFRSIRFSIPDDDRAIVHMSYNRNQLEDFHGHNLPAYPDLIPYTGTLRPGNKLGIEVTNTTGGASDFTVELRYEVVEAGGG